MFSPVGLSKAGKALLSFPGHPQTHSGKYGAQPQLNETNFISSGPKLKKLKHLDNNFKESKISTPI